MNEKNIRLLGWLATFMAITMYVAYIPQIINNLNGVKGDFIQPFVAAINCTLWICYGLFKENRDMPLAIANIPGVLFGLIAGITALI